MLITKRKKAVFAIAAIFILVLSACGNATETGSPTEGLSALDAAVTQTLSALQTAEALPTATSTPAPTATLAPVTKSGPTNFPADVNPLTGLKVSNPDILNRRPVMIKVSNYPREGRPHAGLSSADIVIDYYMGVGMDRFMGIYYGQDATQVGPIRSGRLVDRFLVAMYQGVLGMEYADAYVYGKLVDRLGYSRMISSSTDTCPAICSNATPQTVVSVFANTSEFTKLYEKKYPGQDLKQNLDGMAFNSVPPSGGVDGEDLTVHYGIGSIGNWRYDAAKRKYLRFQEAETTDPEKFDMVPQVDRLTNEQLAFSNVVVMFVYIETLNRDDTLHEYHIMNKQDRALIFRDGKMYDVTFKTAKETPIQFFNTDGTIFELQPGNTWIQIVGVNSTVEKQSEGTYLVTQKEP